MIGRTLDEIVQQRPVSQMRAAALPAGTEQLTLVAAIPQRLDDACASWLRMTAVLLEYEGQVLADEGPSDRFLLEVDTQPPDT